MRCQQKHELLHTSLKFSSLIHSSWKMTKGKRSGCGLGQFLEHSTPLCIQMFLGVRAGGEWFWNSIQEGQQKLLCTEAYKLSSVGSWSLAACHPVGKKKTRWQSVVSHLALSSLYLTFQVAGFLSKTSVGLAALPGAGAHGCRISLQGEYNLI